MWILESDGDLLGGMFYNQICPRRRSRFGRKTGVVEAGEEISRRTNQARWWYAESIPSKNPPEACFC